MLSDDARGHERADWLTVTQLATFYKQSPSSIRLALAAERKRLDAAQWQAVCFKRAGPFGDLYEPGFVSGVFGRRAAVESDVVSQLRTQHPGVPGMLLFDPRGSSGDVGIFMAVLESRKKAGAAYDFLLARAIEHGGDLRIRCLTGTDFFNAHKPTGDAFSKRNAPTKVLLMYPFGHGAQVRARAERDADDLAFSQFLRDAVSTLTFMQAYGDRWNIDAKWVDDLPMSLLVWTTEYALVEAYDHGRESQDMSGCIGRKAPVLLVRGGAPYHTLLRDGFDYVFGGRMRDTLIRTYSLREVASAHRKKMVKGTLLRSGTTKRPARRREGAARG
jgi:hypothetical protein